MHLDHGHCPVEYKRYVGRKTVFILGLVLATLLAVVFAVSSGASCIPLIEVAKSLMGMDVGPRVNAIVWNIRLPQVLAALLAGSGLAIAGAVMQAILRNPLGSPFTLGISHAAAFGAALSVMVLESGVMSSGGADVITITHPFAATTGSFVFSLVAAFIIVGVMKVRGTGPEVMVLSGVALGAFFTAGTMLLQFFADDVQLAAMVFWTFGDASRASWPELAFIAPVTLVSGCYFVANSWNYNAIDAGDETARGLGVRVEMVRVVGMLTASLLTAVLISFLGIIGFVGLVVPHMVRRVIGSDHRFLLPAAFVAGGGLLLLSDTVARLILSPHVLPVSVLTAFLGAPAFFWLILRERK